MEGSNRDGFWQRWQAQRKVRQERREEAKQARRAEVKRLGARAKGFLRFYGGKLLRGGARLGNAVRGAARMHQQRTYAQRLWFGLAFAGIAAWAVVGLDLVPRLMQPSLQLPEIGLQEGTLQETPIGPTRVEGSQPAPLEGNDTPFSATEIASGARPADSTNAQHEPGLSGSAVETGSSTEPTPVIPQVPSIPAASVDSMVWPVAGEMTRAFGWHRHPVFNDWRYSPGVAIQPLEAERTVRSALAGRVKDVVNEGGLWRLSVEHAGGWLTEYEGLAEVHVDSLAVVATGEPLGIAGEGSPTGIYFAVRQGAEAVDPSALVSEPIPVASSLSQGGVH